jgi:hypothetical protein
MAEFIDTLSAQHLCVAAIGTFPVPSDRRHDNCPFLIR